MSGCSSTTVSTALQRLLTVADEVEVCQKFMKKKLHAMVVSCTWTGTSTATAGTTMGDKPRLPGSYHLTSQHNVSSFYSPKHAVWSAHPDIVFKADILPTDHFFERQVVA